MASYTCITCRVAFASIEVQRGHYKSDWHRYNLKRKVADMSPITSDEFRQRVLSQQAQIAQSTQSVKSYCQVCNKNFNTENAYANHMQSKKHKAQEAKVTKELEKQKEKRQEKKLEENNEKNICDDYDKKKTKNQSKANVDKNKNAAAAAADNEDDMEVEEVSDEEWEDYEGDAIPVTDCLFCFKSSKTIDENSHHMIVHHSFFLPFIEYLVDLEGLFTYLGEKVGCGFVCLWCNKQGKTFHALDAVQRHMRDKGHCKLQFDGDAAFEFSDFYDYRSSYPDYNHDGEKKYDVDMKEVEDEEIPEDVLQSTADGYQLVLPSGAKIGHRELFRYYKQNVPPTREVAVRNNATINRLNTHYKALGWYGSGGKVGEARLADLRFMQKFKSKPHLTMGMKNNKLKQKHYRPQVVF
ncbi:cytoplasmic 60S subunit biogenesis factor ZNF622-like [Antedon mediterranea]|uniref:cytoplasmic 60S subunit biogenesis factor ZNF622-like n=1 Tax=Antedon mediterranea TaxID=105859 RepID=UPI003AF97A83